jgi:S1/P1 Nuclease
MKKKFCLAAIIGLIGLLPLQSGAWGVLGHRIVGEIADSYLTSKAKKEVARILGNESLAMCSNWADFIKSDPSFKYLYNWHFINFDGGLSKDQVMAYLDKDTAVDAYTKINFLTAELQKRGLPHETQVMYLRLLVHIVGDIHQPMHVGRLQDLGGNKVKVLWFRDSVNLHQVWDERLIEFQQLSYTEYARVINFTTKAQRKEWFNEPLSSWIYQSYQYAERIYSDIKTPGQKLDYRYNFDYVEILNQQLLKGGVHLAGLINKIFN